MEVYATEEQQWEAIKKWMKRYWDRLSWLIIIVLAIIAGGNYWRHHIEKERERAGNEYMSFVLTLTDEDMAVALKKGTQFIAEFPKSPYSALVALALAKDLVAREQLDESEHFLNFVMTEGQTQPLRALARVRLMRLYWAQNEFEKGLALYDESKAVGFITELAEIKGDILVKQKDTAGAINAYKTAYVAAAQSGMIGPLLKMKMENLGIDLDALQREAMAQA